MRIVASSLLVIAGCLFVYLLTLGSTRSGYVRQEPVTYKFEKPTDWAKDSTVSYSKKNYCEYVYNQEDL
jgi:hypothetical protein